MLVSLQRAFPLAVLLAGLLALVAIGVLAGGEETQVSLTEMLIRVVAVVGMYVFIGNSGILSFGHVGFMCIGAYAAAWATVDPTWKQMMLTGLPDVLQNNQYPFLPAVLGGGVLAAAVALLLGAAIMRLSGIAGSIATFAFLVIVNSVYSNWDSVTAGTSSIVGVPNVVGPWIALAFAAGAVVLAHLFQRSRWGLMLCASRDDEVAAKSSAVRVVVVRLVGFVASAFIVGVAGGLYGHFLGILTADTFYLNLSFITLAMLVVGGMGSLTGAVVGTVVVTVVVELLRRCEAGVPVGGTLLRLPEGSQEVGLGIVMALILIFRPSGLAGGRNVVWPAAWRRAEASAPPPGSRRVPAEG